MPATLTVRDLTAAGGPLHEARLLAGRGGLEGPVTWAVSLRPYAPAIPPLKGGEIALAGIEVLSRHDPPITLADVVRQLASLKASALVLRGKLDDPGLLAADETCLPVFELVAGDAPADVEQAIMRECALFEARREVRGVVPEPGAWLDPLLQGQVTSNAEAQIMARRNGVTLANECAVVFLTPRDESGTGELEGLAAAIERWGKEHGVVLHAREVEGGAAVVAPAGSEGRAVQAVEGRALAAGIGRERHAGQMAQSLAEARVAAVSSALLHNGAPVRYAEMGVERLLVRLYMERRADLEAFVEETLGPLFSHDKRSATPLLPTVAAFAQHGGRLRETAAALSVHRNTLAYRLDRAADILNADLKDPNTRLEIELALKAKPLVDDRRPATGDRSH